jgi:hypothetical protein
MNEFIVRGMGGVTYFQRVVSFLFEEQASVMEGRVGFGWEIRARVLPIVLRMLLWFVSRNKVPGNAVDKVVLVTIEVDDRHCYDPGILLGSSVDVEMA